MLKQVTLPDGGWIHYDYDPAHRLTGVSDSHGNSITYDLDNAGNVKKETVTDPAGQPGWQPGRHGLPCKLPFRTCNHDHPASSCPDPQACPCLPARACWRLPWLACLSWPSMRRPRRCRRTRPAVAVYNTYDILGRLITRMDGNGFQTTYTYDANGNRTSLKDGLGRTTTYTYDALNRLKTITDPDHYVTTLQYDALDHLVSVTDPRSLTTTYTYDGLDNLLKVVSPDTGTTTLTQDAAGNLKTKTDARGKTGTWAWDGLNRVKSVDWGDQVWGFTWDSVVNGVGQPGQFSDADGTTAFAYDTQGRTTSVSRTQQGRSGADGQLWLECRRPADPDHLPVRTGGGLHLAGWRDYRHLPEWPAADQQHPLAGMGPAAGVELGQRPGMGT